MIPDQRDEWEYIRWTLERLYSAQRDGDETVWTAQKVTRWEAVQKALQGYPELLGVSSSK
ncbi:hypothetical protein ACIREO_14195 [Streptomyces sp. NPDC102441]|uniref:hypothetical protein n=1 Tax=Streptomyces sp. NPDC102441 TaxID=3366176 RepID=UPI0038185925